ncbi:hypothetical protein DICVIV_12620 [Dictyocaulus viviparus]|uniref:Uncharacterized protein n=1 Tax=Dictyocaulus viviparus TaxID=29172 RepID=A0A0D8XA12_DICVI|nr:hypothetical protein DICVIV_12620 [Dictyocaulus viviparus]
MENEWMPPLLMNTDEPLSQPQPIVFVIYSIPAMLLLAVIFIVKWRPCYEFVGIRHCLRWYLHCCSKENLKEMQSFDRERILTIDAESLASTALHDSPRLSLKQNSFELWSATGGERQPSISTLNDLSNNC